MAMASRALKIPEILAVIFQFLTDASNASVARVCKQWSDLALDILWREVENLHRLLSLLAPLEDTGNHLYAFKRPLESSDWRRFERYRWRVRRLAYPGRSRDLHQSAFDDIARSRTSLDIFPALHTLQWDAPLSLCVMFMHKNIKTFAVILPPNALDIGPLFDNARTRMPNITRLSLSLGFSNRSIQFHTTSLLRSLTKLQKLILFRFCLTIKLAESVSQLNNLESIEFYDLQEVGLCDPSDVVQFEPTLAQDSFPSLWDLTITVAFDDAARFLNQSFAPTNITTLYLESPRLEAPADFHHLVTTIASKCQFLKTLVLRSYIDTSRTPAPVPASGTTDTTQHITLRPLLKCRILTSLRIEHHLSLGLQQADIEELARAWPAAERLLLNTAPADILYSPLTLRALLPFAQHCPVLWNLGLFLDATATADLELELDVGVPTPQFKALRDLEMGASLLDDASTGAAALFLSRLWPLHLHCSLDAWANWDEPPEPGMVPALVEAAQERFELWEKVENMLPALVRLRGEEGERARAGVGQ